MNSRKSLYMPGEVCIAELVHPLVTGADLDYIGSITIAPETLEASGLLPGQMVYIDDVTRKAPPWRTYIVKGEVDKGEIVMNGPPAYHFHKGDPVTIRGGALVSFEDMPAMGNGHTKVYFKQEDGKPNRVARTEPVDVPQTHWRQMCISKLHRIMVTGTNPDGPEALIVDADILDKAGFPAGIEVQFTSLADGALRRTCVQAGPRGTGKAEIHGSGAQYIKPGTRLVSLAEVWLPYEDAVKVKGPQVVCFDETLTDRNVVSVEIPGWRPA